ncbi:MAG: response regulator [Gemmatimonadales bacterium]
MDTPPGERPRWRIIATDDSASELSAVVDTLREAGHCVFAAYDGLSALELVGQLPGIDLLITNTRLGIVNGPELMRRARAMRPDMPILHVVQQGHLDDRAWPADVLTLREPFTPTELLTAVGGLLA